MLSGVCLFLCLRFEFEFEFGFEPLGICKVPSCAQTQVIDGSMNGDIIKVPVISLSSLSLDAVGCWLLCVCCVCAIMHVPDISLHEPVPMFKHDISNN